MVEVLKEQCVGPGSQSRPQDSISVQAGSFITTRMMMSFVFVEF